MKKSLLNVQLHIMMMHQQQCNLQTSHVVEDGSLLPYLTNMYCVKVVKVTHFALFTIKLNFYGSAVYLYYYINPFKVMKCTTFAL